MENHMETSRQRALNLVILIGIVSLFADMTYEGARSITGPYMMLLGASATVVGFVAGFGELVGYGLRLVSGYIADKTGQYWPIIIVGFMINLLAVPLLALAGRWEIAALLIVTERAGRAIRTPARDVLLSHATHKMGRGWGFGLHEALDQTGAMVGPLAVSLVLYLKHGYSLAFGILLIPALLALLVVSCLPKLYPRPQDLEFTAPLPETSGLPRIFWLYLLASVCVAAGFADFSLIAFHFKGARILSDSWIPILYSVAMGVEALSALLFGRLFDRFGYKALILASLVSAFFAPLVFLGGFELAILGVALWGIGMGTQDSIMRAAVAPMVPANRRGTAYGVFNLGYGIFWFLGSALMGYLYDISMPILIGFSVVIQLLSIPLFFKIHQESHQKKES